MALIPLKSRILAETAARPEKPDANKKLRILYVEDDEMNWEVAQLQLSNRYQIERASTALQALSMLRAHDFDAVLMDIQLSGSELNGIELAQLIRGKIVRTVPGFDGNPVRASLPIIFLTANDARYSKNEIAAAGGSELVTKPVNFLNLALSISRCLVKQTTPSRFPTGSP